MSVFKKPIHISIDILEIENISKESIVVAWSLNQNKYINYDIFEFKLNGLLILNNTDKLFDINGNLIKNSLANAIIKYMKNIKNIQISRNTNDIFVLFKDQSIVKLFTNSLNEIKYTIYEEKYSNCKTEIGHGINMNKNAKEFFKYHLFGIL